MPHSRRLEGFPSGVCVGKSARIKQPSSPILPRPSPAAAGAGQPRATPIESSLPAAPLPFIMAALAMLLGKP
jgi:hypothetical protein